MAFRVPHSIDAAIGQHNPEIIVTMGGGEDCPPVSGAERIDWDLPDPAGESKDDMRRIRDEIENRAKELVNRIQ